MFRRVAKKSQLAGFFAGGVKYVKNTLELALKTFSIGRLLGKRDLSVCLYGLSNRSNYVYSPTKLLSLFPQKDIRV